MENTKTQITFELDGEQLIKNVEPIRIITYDNNENIWKENELTEGYSWLHEHDENGKLLKSVKTDTVTNKILDERSAADGVKKNPDGLIEEVYHSEDGLIFGYKHIKDGIVIYEMYREKDSNKRFKYDRILEKGVMTEIWYPIPGNKKIADIKITENGKVITGKRTWSEKDHMYTEEFSDGSKGFAQWTEDNSKLLHLVERTGSEQVNTFDGNGNIKSIRFSNWKGYESYIDHILNDSLSYTISVKDGIREEKITETELSPEGKKIRTITYKVRRSD